MIYLGVLALLRNLDYQSEAEYGHDEKNGQQNQSSTKHLEQTFVKLAFQVGKPTRVVLGVWDGREKLSGQAGGGQSYLPASGRRDETFF